MPQTRSARSGTRHSVTTPDDNAKIAKVACDALTRLSTDGDLIDAIKGMLRYNKYLKSTQALIEDLKQFDATFLPAEVELMRRQGLEYPAIFDALRVGLTIRPSARAKDTTPEAVLYNINRAQSQVCKFAAGAVSDRQRAQTEWTFGGILLLGIDVAGAVTITAGTGGAGMPAAGTLLLTSVTLGSTAALAGATGNIP